MDADSITVYRIGKPDEEYSPLFENLGKNVRKFGKTIGDSMKARQKRKQTDANARLVASKGLAAPAPKMPSGSAPKAKPAKSSSNKTLLWVGGGIAAIALIVTIVIVVRKKKSKGK